MAVWSSRTSGYKVGVGALFLGSAIYLVGFASPYWWNVKVGLRHHVHSGIWMGCYQSDYGKDCVTISGNVDPSIKAVQAMECLGLIGLFFACVYVLYVNARKTAPAHNRYLEILTAVGGLCGFIGCMVYVGELLKHQLLVKYLGWAYGFSLTGSILTMVTAVIIYIANRADQANSPAAAFVTFSGAAAAPVAMVMPPGGVYPPPGKGGYPPQPGVMYVAQPGYVYPQGYSASAQNPGPGGPAPTTATAPPPYAGNKANEG